jgi:hypothetical protein
MLKMKPFGIFYIGAQYLSSTSLLGPAGPQLPEYYNATK